MKEFDEFDDTAVGGEQPEGRGSVPSYLQRGAVKAGKNVMRRMRSWNPSRRRADHQRSMDI